MSDGGSVFYCNNAGHSHATCAAAREGALSAHRGEAAGQGASRGGSRAEEGEVDG